MLCSKYRCSNLAMLYLLLALSIQTPDAEGATHVVGYNNGWTLFRNSTNWTQGKEFHVGDVLVFNYERDLHNVMQVNSTAYTDCAKDSYIRLFTSGNDSLVLSEAGESWYICGVENHCNNGQKLSIYVIP